MPEIRVAPDVVSLVVLPPLLYAAGEEMPWRELRQVWGVGVENPVTASDQHCHNQPRLQPQPNTGQHDRSLWLSDSRT